MAWDIAAVGVGITVLVEKIAGAAAEEGRDLAAVKAVANKVNDNGRSMGMALTSCIVPAAGNPTFDLPEDQMEIGVGIHGEPGRHREPLTGAAGIARQLVEPVLEDLDFSGGPTIAMLNGMGGTPLIELYLLYGEVAALLESAGVRVARSLVGNLLTPGHLWLGHTVVAKQANASGPTLRVRGGGPPGDRTLNPRIKSPLLCQLS